MNNSLTHIRGFSLIEMAIVLLIMGLLLGGGLALLGPQIESRKIKDTQRILEDAKEALIGFAMANGRLPCPAPAGVASGTALAGLEPTPVIAAGCTNLAGVLPWATLGVNETDGWGNRFTYRIAMQFTRTLLPPQTVFTGATCPPPINPTRAVFALCSQGDMSVLSTGGGSTLATMVPVMVISHGKNGTGAYNTQGNQLPVGADTDELDNQLTGAGTTTANNVFINKTPTATFDDIVTWLSPNVLFNRMVQAGRLP